LSDDTVTGGAPVLDLEDAATMATAEPEFEEALDAVFASRAAPPPLPNLSHTVAMAHVVAPAPQPPVQAGPPALPRHTADLAEQTHTMVLPSAPPLPPSSQAPASHAPVVSQHSQHLASPAISTVAKFDDALFQPPSVTPRVEAAKAARPPFRPRIETADHFEPSGDQYVPDADLMWKPGEPAGDIMPLISAPSPGAPAPPARAEMFTDNEFWAPPPQYRGPSPTLEAADAMEALIRGGQASQSISTTKTRIPTSYAIVGAAILATMLCALAIAFTR
jgi:hypothetical protein